jgi:hypothetical protein
MRDQARLGISRQWFGFPNGIMRTSIRVAHLLGLGARSQRNTSESGAAPTTRAGAPAPVARVRDGDVKSPKALARKAKPKPAGPKHRKANARKSLPDYSALARLSLSKAAPPLLSKTETQTSWDRAFRRARLGLMAQASWANSVPPKHQSETARSWDEAFRKVARR